MDAILSGIGSTASAVMPAATTSAFGLTPDMIKSLGSGEKGSKGAQAIMQQMMEQAAKLGSNPQIPHAQPRQVSIEDIRSLLGNRTNLGT